MTGTGSPSPKKEKDTLQTDATTQEAKKSNYDPFSMMGWAFSGQKNKEEEEEKEGEANEEE